MTPHRAGPSGPSQTDRGVASQVDFLASMLIRIVVLSLVLTAGTVLLHTAGPVDATNSVIAQRAAARLVEDLLVTTPGDVVLNATCTRAFFTTATGVCGFPSTWSGDDATYLQTALGIGPSSRLAVAITTTDGGVLRLAGTPLALGDPLPSQSSTIRHWHRHIGLAIAGSDRVSVYRLTVVVWG